MNAGTRSACSISVAFRREAPKSALSTRDRSLRRSSAAFKPPVTLVKSDTAAASTASAATSAAHASPHARCLASVSSVCSVQPCMPCTPACMGCSCSMR